MNIDFNKFFQSKAFKMILCGIAALIVLMIVFKMGVVVGIRKGDFSCRWGENYHMNFAGPRGGFFKDFNDRNFIDAHGVFGQIIKIDPSTGSGQAALIIKGQNNVEKIVLAKDDTAINNSQGSIKLSDLKVDDYIVVIGQPNASGQIEAKLIRVSPSRMMGMPIPPMKGAPVRR